MSPQELERTVRAARLMRDDMALYARSCLKVKGKDAALVPFDLNRAQRELHRRLEEQRSDGGKVRALILKGRQQGISTYLQARMRWRLKHQRGLNAMTIAHEQEASDNLFAMAKRYHDNEPEEVRPQTGAANAKELWFSDIDGRMQVATAGTKDTGRSKTIQLFHGSEAAFWPNAESHAAGIGQTVPDMPGTEVYLESTANGIGEDGEPNDFYKRWLQAVDGKGDYIAVFLPWFWQPEYARPVPKDWQRSQEEQELADLYDLSDEQLAWRRAKIESDFRGDVSRFQQEYPCNWREAFVAEQRDTFISAAPVMRARACQTVSVSGPLVAACDPARYGPDSTAIVARQGRKTRMARRYQGKSAMEVAGLIARFIEQYHPAAFFIDVVGLGAGIYDRLVELGYAGQDDDDLNVVIPVNFAEKAAEDDKYVNKRAECWDGMKQWLEAWPCSLPDEDAWLLDLTSTGYEYDSRGRLRLKSKEWMRSKGLPSPDLGDALAMTFAEPVREKVRRRPTMQVEILDPVANY